MCSLPNGIRTGPVTNDVVADSRDQPTQRAQSTNAGTVTTTHGLPVRVARNALAVPVPSPCEAAQPPRPLTRELYGFCRKVAFSETVVKTPGLSSPCTMQCCQGLLPAFGVGFTPHI